MYYTIFVGGLIEIVAGGGKQETRIGANGKPLKGQPELTSKQRK